MKVAAVVDPSRVLLAREIKGWTQKEMVEATSNAFSVGALSQIEKGHSRPSPTTLSAIATAVDFPVSFFIGRSEDRQPEGFFRSLRSTSARDRNQYLGMARLLHDFVRALEEHVRLPDLELPTFRPVVLDEAKIEELAQDLRNSWGVSPGPIANVVREAERHGIVVARVKAFTHEVDAFSVRFADRPIVALGSSKGISSRSRFDAAHEIAHGVLHGDTDANTKEAEKQAHRFAAAFLMPASEIESELPSTADWPKLMELKARWRVSMSALLVRSKDLGKMSPQRYVSAVKAMSARGWRQVEPGDDRVGALEAPVLLGRAISAADDLGFSVERIASEAGLPLTEIRNLISQIQDPRPRVQL